MRKVCTFNMEGKKTFWELMEKQGIGKKTVKELREKANWMFFTDGKKPLQK